MNKAIVLLFALLFVGSATAFTLEVLFGQGVSHHLPSGSVSSAAPSVGTRYFLTDTGVTTSTGSATVFSEATIGGTIQYETYETQGDCTWSGVINTEVVALTSLNGRAISLGDKVYWSYVPNNPAVTSCKLKADLNVLSA